MIEPTVTPAQYEACVELVDRSTGLNCVSDTQVIVGLLVGLVQSGIEALTIIKWLNLLPRVADRSAIPDSPAVVEPSPGQLTLSTESALTPAMRRALEPVNGHDKTRAMRALLDADAANDPELNRHAPGGGRRRKPASGECVDCGATFDMPPGGGRPPKRCEQHRRSATTRRQEPAA